MPYLAITTILVVSLAEQYISPLLNPWTLSLPLALPLLASLLVNHPRWWYLGPITGLILDLTSLNPFGLNLLGYSLATAILLQVIQRHPKQRVKLAILITGLSAALLAVAISFVGPIRPPWGHPVSWLAAIALQTLVATVLAFLCTWRQPVSS